MEENEKKNNIKQFILKVGIVFLLVLVVFTFFSKSIHNSMLPKVRLTKSQEGTLKRSLMIYDYLYEREDTGIIIAEGSWTIKEVFVKEGDVVTEGDSLFSIDIDRYKADLLRLQSQAVALDNQLKNPYLSAEDKRAIELSDYAAWREYRLLRDSFPSSGEVVATISGEVLKVNIKDYDVLVPGSTIIEENKEESFRTLKFNLSFSEESTYTDLTKVSVRVKYKADTKTESFAIIEKERTESGYTIFLDTPEDLEEKGVIQYILLEKKSERYNQILPSSCIHEDMNGYYIYVVDETKSGQSFRYYITKSYVTVIETNDMYSAVEIEPYVSRYGKESIVSYTSKPIEAGDEVIIL